MQLWIDLAIEHSRLKVQIAKSAAKQLS
jgi:hypothetical protein